MNRFQFFAALSAASMLAPAANAAMAAKYDPLAIDASFQAFPLELTVHDAKRNRDIPVRVYLPEAVKPAPVVLFSHGLGGSRNGNEFLGQHWAARGYVAVFVQHPGSDDSVWKDKPSADRMGAMREAASLQNLSQRAADVPAVLDQLEIWNAESKQPLAGRMDLRKNRNVWPLLRCVDHAGSERRNLSDSWSEAD